MKWNKVEFTNLALPRVKNHTTISSSSGLFIFGGYDGNSHQSNLYKVDLKGKVFLNVKTNGELPCGRNGHTATLYENEIYVIGGWNSSNPQTTREIYKLNLESFDWKKIHPTEDYLVSCNMHSANLYQNKIFVFRGGDGTHYLNDLHSYDILNNSWQLVSTSGFMPSARANHSSAIFKSKLFIFGGWNGCDRLRDLYSLDLETLVWALVESSLNCPKPRAGMTLISYCEGLLLFGGSGECNESYKDLWKFDTENYTWNLLRPAGNPSSRAGHTFTQVSCREFLLFGGSSGNSFSNENFILDIWPKPEPPDACFVQELSFTRFFNNQEFSDLVMVVEGKVFYAHKIVITQRSEYFKQMLSVNMRETLENQIEIKDVRFEVFRILMKYLYTGIAEIGAGTEGQELRVGYILEVLRAADRFLLLPIVRNCELLLWNKLTKENVLDVLAVVENINSCTITEYCYWVLQNSQD